MKFKLKQKFDVTMIIITMSGGIINRSKRDGLVLHGTKASDQLPLVL